MVFFVATLILLILPGGAKIQENRKLFLENKIHGKSGNVSSGITEGKRRASFNEKSKERINIRKLKGDNDEAVGFVETESHEPLPGALIVVKGYDGSPGQGSSEEKKITKIWFNALENFDAYKEKLKGFHHLVASIQNKDDSLVLRADRNGAYRACIKDIVKIVNPKWKKENVVLEFKCYPGDGYPLYKKKGLSFSQVINYGRLPEFIFPKTSCLTVFLPKELSRRLKKRNKGEEAAIFLFNLDNGFGLIRPIGFFWGEHIKYDGRECFEFKFLPPGRWICKLLIVGGRINPEKTFPEEGLLFDLSSQKIGDFNIFSKEKGGYFSLKKEAKGRINDWGEIDAGINIYCSKEISLVGGANESVFLRNESKKNKAIIREQRKYKKNELWISEVIGRGCKQFIMPLYGMSLGGKGNQASISGLSSGHFLFTGVFGENFVVSKEIFFRGENELKCVELSNSQTQYNKKNLADYGSVKIIADQELDGVLYFARAGKDGVGGASLKFVTQKKIIYLNNLRKGSYFCFFVGKLAVVYPKEFKVFPGQVSVLDFDCRKMGGLLVDWGFKRENCRADERKIIKASIISNLDLYKKLELENGYKGKIYNEYDRLFLSKMFYYSKGKMLGNWDILGPGEKVVFWHLFPGEWKLVLKEKEKEKGKNKWDKWVVLKEKNILIKGGLVKYEKIR